MLHDGSAPTLIQPIEHSGKTLALLIGFREHLELRGWIPDI